jgi:hypothetical protein
LTIAIGINAGLYAILAADTRVTYFSPKSSFYDDNKSKVHKTSTGLITGAGFVPLLDLVNSRLAIETITNTNTILSIIKEAREEIRQSWKHYSLIDDSIAKTGWIFSYYTLLNEISTLQLGVYHNNLSSDDFILFGPGDPAIIYPSELIDQEVKIVRSIVDKIDIPKDQSEIQSSIQQNVVKVVALIKILVPLCQSISNRFQIGIHMNGQMGISEIVDIPDEGQVYDFSIAIK